MIPSAKRHANLSAALTLSGRLVGALRRRPKKRSKAAIWAFLYHLGNIGLAGAPHVSSGIKGLTGALLLCPNFIGLHGCDPRSRALLHRPAMEFIGGRLDSRMIELARRPSAALSVVMLHTCSCTARYI
jgi:hypothetical protein